VNILIDGRMLEQGRKDSRHGKQHQNAATMPWSYIAQREHGPGAAALEI
jgi:hypothetical protein